MFCLGQKKTATPLRVALGVALALAGIAGAAAGQVPVVVAESESFEIVGRWYEDGLRFHVDEAQSNAPVLGAQLTVEAQGEEIAAAYDAAAGVYRIDEAAWLAPLRAAGEHPLSFTLLAGEAADLLAGDLVVGVDSSADEPGAGAAQWARWLGLLAIPALLAFFGWRRRSTGGGA